ncbi:MAG: peptidoglycan-binding domain-containing protein [Actinomycetota bacterium]
MNRRGLLAVVAAIAVISAGIGWFAGQRIKSPPEIAADQAPPEPSLITVPVEFQELSQRLVIRGTVRSDESTPLDATSSSGDTIITRLTVEAGDELNEGDVAIEVAGRPIFVLEGELPVFRSLIPTLDGPDVTQLEEALVRLGLDPGPVDGLYDDDTADAVEELYRAAGYKPVEPSEEDLANLRAERAAVTDATEAVSAATDALEEAEAGPTESTRIQLDQAVVQATRALEDAQAGAELVAATEARQAAESMAADAATEANEAAQRLAEANGGTNPDTGVPPTDEELAAFADADEAARQAKSDADQAVIQAKQAETRATEDKTRNIEAATADLALAEASRREALATDTAAANDALRAANTRLREARATLATTEAVVDTRLPAAELYFLPSLPRKVQTLAVSAGDRPSGPVMTVTGSSTALTSAVAAADRRLIEVGDAAVIEDDDLGIRADATITFIADNPGGGETPSDRYRIRLEPNEELPEEALNVNFRITIPVTSSGGEVMVVPLAALSAGSDGTTRVEVERSPGQTEIVIVNPGLRAQGLVQIEVVDGALEPGDRVVVGRDLVLPGQAGSDDDEDGSDAEDG